MTAIYENRRFALLIDADNAQASAMEYILAEVARYGTVTAKRCYGDWTGSQLSSWKSILLKHAIQPMQQFSYTTGKNATDSAMIIDAMDLLYTKNFDGFCIVSSDSDFTRLATRIRENGLDVLGFGQKKTPEPFRVACNKFIYTEVLLNASDEPKQASSSSEEPLADSIINGEKPDLKGIFKAAIESAKGDDDSALLAAVGSYIQRNHSDFDPRNYGCKKLSDLVRKQDYLKAEPREGGHLYIRLKE
jgi:uncharacterized LabA/DUF88 family protein